MVSFDAEVTSSELTGRMVFARRFEKRAETPGKIPCGA